MALSARKQRRVAFVGALRTRDAQSLLRPRQPDHVLYEPDVGDAHLKLNRHGQLVLPKNGTDEDIKYISWWYGRASNAGPYCEIYVYTNQTMLYTGTFGMALC